MLTLSQVSKAYAGRVLFDDASLQVNRGDRIGLVGPNGAGKSTLFSLILGSESPDSGRVTMERTATMGFLRQETATTGDETILELATTITPRMGEVHEIIRRHRGKDEDAPEYHEALEAFADADGWQLEARAKSILKGLAFRETDFDRPARELSGGWVMRAHLARLLVQEPDLLLLDEPTNHLDLESLEWFQNYLRNWRGAILVISHDRAFLNSLVQHIIEISRSRISRYRGNWDDYVREKAARDEQHLAAYKNQQKEIAALQEFADRFRAKASKAAQAQSKLKQIDRMERIEAPEAEEKKVHFKFPQPQRCGQRVISLRHVAHAYGSLQVYSDLNFEAERGQRTVLVGPNGAGKSTLLKLLAGVLPIQQGERDLGYQVEPGYFAQHRGEMLDPKNTVLQEAMTSCTLETTTRTLLGAFLFRGDDVFKPVSVLSGGEKTRLALAKMLLAPPNLLLMDEPTTHLDIGSIDALVTALSQYEGTLIFISHDVYFIRALATSVLHISAGKLTPYAGNYDYYLTKSRATSERAALTAGEKLTDSRAGTVVKAAAADAKANGASLKDVREQRKRDADERKDRAKQKRDKEKQVATLEARIHEIEQKQKVLAQELENPATYQAGARSVEIKRELRVLADRMCAANAEWEKAAEELGAFSDSEVAL